MTNREITRIVYNEFGKSHMTLKDLSAKAHIGVNTINNFLQTENIHLTTLCRICNALNIELKVAI